MCDQLWLIDDDLALTGINLTFKVAIGTDFINRQVGVNLTTKHLRPWREVGVNLTTKHLRPWREVGVNLPTKHLRPW